jgi:hypothetical protein
MKKMIALYSDIRTKRALTFGIGRDSNTPDK